MRPSTTALLANQMGLSRAVVAVVLTYALGSVGTHVLSVAGISSLALTTTATPAEAWRRRVWFRRRRWRRRSRAHPCRQRLPLRIILRMPVLPTLVPWRAARLRVQRIGQQDALERFAGNHQTRDAVEIAARLILGPCRGARRERLEIRARAA